MPEITALMVDAREPQWVKSLKFNGIPTLVTMLETGDVQAVTSDGCTLIIERKTPDDFLNTLKDDRLFPQLARMTEKRNAEQNMGKPMTTWPFLVITGQFLSDANRKVVTQRGVTGWNIQSVEGALLSAQELGIFVIHANGDLDYENCILRLGRRNRDPEMKLLPPRPANIFGPKATFLAGLPGIGIERVEKILDWSDNNIAHALSGLTDLSIDTPIGYATRKTIKAMLGLEDNQSLEVMQKENN